MASSFAWKPKLAIRPTENSAPALTPLSVIGLGYVGVVSVGCLSARGYTVIGVDIDSARVDTVARGCSPIVERGLEALLSQGVRSGRVTATCDIERAVADTQITLLAVGTPTSADGGCDLSYVRAACSAIGAALANKTDFHCVILRCSVPPGTTMDVAVPEIEAASGKILGRDFGICFSPEFLREGNAVADFADPPKVVLAASDARAEAMARPVVANEGQHVLTTTMAAAETLKYVDNIWHAAKVVFANEVGRFCKPLDVDSHEVMRLFVEDRKLNLSPYYLKPGFAFGGSCLPKEVRAAMHIGAKHEVDLPLIDSLLASNDRQIIEAQRMITALARSTGGSQRHGRVGMLGLTFKPGTDDLRESPMLELMARLMADGIRVSVCDPNLVPGQRLTQQLRSIRAARPALAAAIDALETGGVLETVPTLIGQATVLVAAHATELFRDAVRRRPAATHVVDLARLFPEVPPEGTYHGISW